MIVDAHVHTHWLASRPRPDEVLTAMRTAGDRNGIQKQILLGSAGFSSGEWKEDHVRDCNTGTLLTMEEDPEGWLGCCVLNPANDPGFMREETDRCIAEGGMLGIKLHVHVNARDRRLDPIMERAAEFDVPLVYHSWYKVIVQNSNESTPADIADLSRRHPDVDILMAHLTGCGARGVIDIMDLPRVHVDTSGGQPEAVTTEYAVRHLGVERVLYGSDFPGRDYATQLARIYGADITDDQKRQILGLNALRLFRIPVREGGA